MNKRNVDGIRTSLRRISLDIYSKICHDNIIRIPFSLCNLALSESFSDEFSAILSAATQILCFCSRMASSSSLFANSIANIHSSSSLFSRTFSASFSSHSSCFLSFSAAISSSSLTILSSSAIFSSFSLCNRSEL